MKIYTDSNKNNNNNNNNTVFAKYYTRDEISLSKKKKKKTNWFHIIILSYSLNSTYNVCVHDDAMRQYATPLINCLYKYTSERACTGNLLENLLPYGFEPDIFLRFPLRRIHKKRLMYS